LMHRPCIRDGLVVETLHATSLRVRYQQTHKYPSGGGKWHNAAQGLAGRACNTIDAPSTHTRRPGGVETLHATSLRSRYQQTYKYRSDGGKWHNAAQGLAGRARNTIDAPSIHAQRPGGVETLHATSLRSRYQPTYKY
jgi:hypothetical protein